MSVSGAVIQRACARMTGLSRARARQLAGDQPDPVYWQLVGLPTLLAPLGSTWHGTEASRVAWRLLTLETRMGVMPREVSRPSAWRLRRWRAGPAARPSGAISHAVQKESRAYSSF